MNYVEKMKQKYAISEREARDISELIIHAYTANVKPVDAPKAVYIAGQPGCGKTCIQMETMRELDHNTVLCDVDNFRYFHPYATDILKDQELLFGELTNNYVRQWNEDLRRYCHDNRLNYVLETTLKDGQWMNDILTDIKSKGYRGEIKLLAVNPKLSLLGIYLRYEQAKKENGMGRMVPLEYHEMCCKNLPISLRHIDEARLFDDLKLYVRNEMLKPQVNHGVTLTHHNPENVCAAYQREQARPWSEQLKQCYIRRREDVLTMMESRKANRAELDQCRAALKLPEESERKKSFYIGW